MKNDNLQLFPRGSQWRRWDLQVQPIKDEWFSRLENKKNEIKESTREYLKEAINRNIEIIAITDHNTGIAIDCALEIVMENKLGIYILPGVEFEAPEGWHCIVIFNPEYKKLMKCNSWDDTVQAFLRSVGRMKGSFFNDNGTTRQVGIHTKDLIKEINQKDIGIVIFAHCDSNKGFFKRGNNTTRKEILEENLKNNLQFIIDTKNLKVGDIQSEVKKIINDKNYQLTIPVISTSDAHKPKELGRFTWIKADPTYDGLKQILCEPESEERTFIGENPPIFKNSSKVIDKIYIKNVKNWFDTEPILFNENLIAIIGEKGSGKTALADLIAYTGGDFTLDEKDQTCFLHKALIPTKQITKTIDGCQIVIKWKNGEQDTKTIYKNKHNNYQTKKKVKYLSQSFIEKRCRPEHYEELQHEIEDIIFQHVPISDRLSETTFKNLRKRKTEDIEIQKKACRDNIINVNRDIYSLEEDIFSLNTKIEEKSNLETELIELKKQKPKPTTKEEKAIENKLSLLSEHRNELEDKVAILKSNSTTISSIRTKFLTLKSTVEKEILEIEKDLKKVGLIYNKTIIEFKPDFLNVLEKKRKHISDEISKIKGNLDNNIKDVQFEPQEMDLSDLSKNKIKDLSLYDTLNWIRKLESDSNIVESARKAIRSYDEKIRKIILRIDVLKKDISDIKNKKATLSKKEKSRNEIFKQYFKLLNEEKKVLEELYAPLKQKHNVKNKNQIEFFVRTELNVENYFQKAKNILDFSKKGIYRRGESELFEVLKNIAVTIEVGEEENIIGEIENLYNSFKKDIDGKELDIRSQLIKGKSKIDFYDWIFDTTDFKIAYSIKYQGTSLELLSPGKKGIVLLFMYLVLDSENDIPLIIDQPEENLDNKSVFPSLVNYFREVKRRRQVILITHNPNLVLNTDAEQIVVANFDAALTNQHSHIAYISGSIENSFVSKKAKIPLEQRGIREHGLDILEGGKLAFKRRREKYGKITE